MLKNERVIGVKNSSMPVQDIQTFAALGGEDHLVFNGPDEQFLGGLVMSAMKRSMGVKDWGNMISGHGGILDRMDSLCFSAPIFFHVVRYFWA